MIRLSKKLREKKAVQTEETLQVVVFQIGEEEYAVDILQVQEIIRPQEIVPMPQAPDFVKGMINLRGHAIPVIDLRERLGVSPSETSDGSATRIIIVRVEEALVGMIVDEVSHVLRIPKSAIEPPPATIVGSASEYITGIAKVEDRLIVLLNISKILSAEERVALVGIHKQLSQQGN